MRRRKRNNKYLLLLIILLGITLGYALVSTTLKINGQALVKKHTWDIHWANPVVSQGSVSNTLPDITEDTGDPEDTKVVWTVDLALPGDYYEFTVDAVNNGDVDAMITLINPSVSPTLPTNPEYIKYEVTYYDGVVPAVHHLLPKKNGNTPTTEKYKVKVYYDETVATAETVNAMTTDTSYTFNLGITYSQATDDAFARPQLKLGDFFTLVPDAETASTDIAGFSGSIPTSDTTLWRVIGINNDGTYDAVSHYTSSWGLTIEGSDGYKNYVAGLQDVASKYAKSGYTVGTRMFGYNGQTLSISDTSDFDGTTTEPLSRTSTITPTTGTGEEFAGGVLGDTLYLKDYQLLRQVYDTTCATSKTGSTETYWIASRYYQYNADVDRFFHGRFLCGYGDTITQASLRYYGGGWYDRSRTYKIRPVITLKKDIVKNGGDGTLNNPYTFE